MYAPRVAQLLVEPRVLQAERISEPAGTEPEKLAPALTPPAGTGVARRLVELFVGRDLRVSDPTEARGLREAPRRRAAAMARAESAVDCRLRVAWGIHHLPTHGLAKQFSGDGHG